MTLWLPPLGPVAVEGHIFQGYVATVDEERPPQSGAGATTKAAVPTLGHTAADGEPLERDVQVVQGWVGNVADGGPGQAAANEKWLAAAAGAARNRAGTDIGPDCHVLLDQPSHPAGEGHVVFERDDVRPRAGVVGRLDCRGEGAVAIVRAGAVGDGVAAAVVVLDANVERAWGVYCYGECKYSAGTAEVTVTAIGCCYGVRPNGQGHGAADGMGTAQGHPGADRRGAVAEGYRAGCPAGYGGGKGDRLTPLMVTPEQIGVAPSLKVTVPAAPGGVAVTVAVKVIAGP